jgi:hypothetical protein
LLENKTTAIQSVDSRYNADVTVQHFSSPRKAKRHVNMIQHVDEQKEIHYECKKTAKALNKNKIRSKLESDSSSRSERTCFTARDKISGK